MAKITVGWMYPNLLNLHGERGSVQALETIGRLGMSVARTEQYIESLLIQPAHMPVQTDVKAFLKRVTQTLTRIQQSGIAAISERRETEDQIVLTITIPK